jgi:hypothetical protein
MLRIGGGSIGFLLHQVRDINESFPNDSVIMSSYLENKCQKVYGSSNFDSETQLILYAV